MNRKIENLKNKKNDFKYRELNCEHINRTIDIMNGDKSFESNAWDRVLKARAMNRVSPVEVINNLFDDFIELHGDRHFGDDSAIIAGIASISGKTITVIACNKGDNLDSRKAANFGMIHPEGYRKAMRLMDQAEKFNRPIITIIDTPGAYPGVSAEERGQASVIAQCIMRMMELKVPTFTIILGEAGSGGALALSVGNYIWMFENAIYSILSPEGFASIIHKDASKARDVVELMKLTSHNLIQLGIVDELVFENDLKAALEALKESIGWELDRYRNMTGDEIALTRQERFRAFGGVVDNE